MYVKIEKQMPEIIHASVQTGLPNLQSCSPRYQIANMGGNTSTKCHSGWNESFHYLIFVSENDEKWCMYVWI